MAARMEVKRQKDKFRVSLFHSDKRREKSHYWNVIDKDPQKLAQILIDLHFEGYPIEEAVKIMRERLNRKDWLGV